MKRKKLSGPGLMRENGKKLMGVWVEQWELEVIDGLAKAAHVKRSAYVRGVLLAVHAAGLTLVELRRMLNGRYRVTN